VNRIGSWRDSTACLDLSLPDEEAAWRHRHDGRIPMLRALNHGDPDPAPRRKRAKRYRIVR
jgi:hypothetical protein